MLKPLRLYGSETDRAMMCRKFWILKSGEARASQN